MLKFSLLVAAFVLLHSSQTKAGMADCGLPFVPDGHICEFVNAEGDCQAYFIDDPIAENCGALLEDACLGRNVVWKVDAFPPYLPPDAGPTGFLDAPGHDPLGPIPTGFNIGRVFAAYAVGADQYRLAMDISAPPSLDFASGTTPVAFDIDGDGSRNTQTEINPGAVSEAPTFIGYADVYVVSIDTNLDGADDIAFTIGEKRGLTLPIGAVAIDPNGTQQRIDGVIVHRFVLVTDYSGTLAGSPQELAVLFLDSDNDGRVDWSDVGVADDIELFVSNVSLLPNLINAHEVMFGFFADSFDDIHLGGGAEEFVVLHAAFPPGDEDCGEANRCLSDGDVCTYEKCMGAGCGSFRVSYGDVDGSGGMPEVEDLICLMDGFADFTACPNADIAPCKGDGVIEVEDLIALVGAFAGIDACDCSTQLVNSE